MVLQFNERPFGHFRNYLWFTSVCNMHTYESQIPHNELRWNILKIVQFEIGHHYSFFNWFLRLYHSLFSILKFNFACLWNLMRLNLFNSHLMKNLFWMIGKELSRFVPIAYVLIWFISTFQLIEHSFFEDLCRAIKAFFKDHFEFAITNNNKLIWYYGCSVLAFKNIQ